jgi:hypothetical protein
VQLLSVPASIRKAPTTTLAQAVENTRSRSLLGKLLWLHTKRVGRIGHRLAVLVGARQEEHLHAALAMVSRQRQPGARRV